MLSECPDIGKTIENFVSAANVGADQWRRTGVLTFDGNRRLSNKVTYGHWSNCFYKGLNTLQYKDGHDLTNINQDDASGFRLDTLTTNKQYANPVVQGHDIVTTRTDYVNKYPSVLQTTSYNFSCTGSTPEVVWVWSKQLVHTQRTQLNTLVT